MKPKVYSEMHKLMQDLKSGKIKEGEAVILNEGIKRNTYALSDGNMKVLETVPRMMEFPEYNIALRELTIKFLIKHGKQIFPNPWRK